MSNEDVLAEVVEARASTTKPLDFRMIETLRKHMLLTVNSMAVVLGTSRPSYYNWIKGTKLHKKNADRVRKVVRGMAHLGAQGHWPNDAVFAANQSQRVFLMQEMLASLSE